CPAKSETRRVAENDASKSDQFGETLATKPRSRAYCHQAGCLFLAVKPLSRCYHQGGMQRRLSARSSGVVESSRSGGGSDSELNHVTRMVPPKSENNPERIRYPGF